MTNQVIETLLQHKSIRKYQEQMPTDEMIQTIVRTGQQAAFASQMYSVLLTRKGKIPFGAPLLFTICIDIHKLETIMAKRGWNVVTNDISLLLFGAQDASLMAQNMIVAAESLGLGTCLLGAAPYRAKQIQEEYKLPERVFPLVQLVIGYPAEDPAPRPRYPLDFTLFEDEYPEFDEETIGRAMAEMDEGYMGQNYYRNANAKIELEDGKKDIYSYENYGWTEHISRKWGQWHQDPKTIEEPLAKCGFKVKVETEEE